MPRFYRLLLRAYPRSLRGRHGAEMAAAFDEQWRRALPTFSGRAKLLALLLTDVVISLRREWRSPDHGCRTHPPAGGH